MKANSLWIGLMTALVLGLASMAAQAQDRTVNCDVGQSLQDAINKARSSAAPLILNVRGICYEDIRFSRDLLTIDGSGEAVIHGSLRNFGARVTIRNIEITGPGFGLFASTGRTRLINVHFIGNEEQGLLISDNGLVAFNGGSIKNNSLQGVVLESGTLGMNDVEVSENLVGIDASMSRIKLENTQVVNNAERGINVTDNSALQVTDSVISSNGQRGIRVNNSSSLSAARVDISWNGSGGVAVGGNSTAEIDACIISNNVHVSLNRSGVFVTQTSYASINNTEVFGNSSGVGVARQSFVRLGGDTVVRDNFGHGLGLGYDSGAIVDDPVIIPENGSGYAVYCDDTESSVENRSGGVGLTHCTGFDSP